MFVVCLSLFVACCVLCDVWHGFVVCSMCAVCCVLFVVCRVLCVVCCVLCAECCVLCVVWSSMRVARCVSCVVVCCLLFCFRLARVACCVRFVDWRLLMFVAWCWLFVSDSCL